MYPDSVVGDAWKNLWVVNGEVVAEARTRTVALLDLDDIYRRRERIFAIRHRANIAADEIESEEIEIDRDKLKTTFPLTAALGKIKEMSEDEYKTYFKKDL